MNSSIKLWMILGLASLLACDSNNPSPFGEPNTFIHYYGNASNTAAVKAMPLPNGNIALGGMSNVTTANIASGRPSTGHFLALVTDSLGQELWRLPIDTLQISLTNDMDIDAQGNMVLCGTEWSEASNSAQTQVKVAKVAGNGTLLWRKTYTIDGANTQGASIKVAANGDYLILGSVGTAASTNMYALRLQASDGAIIWERVYGINAQLDAGASLDEDAQGNLIWLGTITQGNTQKFRMAKANALGNVIWDYSFSFGTGVYIATDILASNNTFTAVGNIEGKSIIWQVNENGIKLWDSGNALSSTGNISIKSLTNANGGDFLLAGSAGLSDNSSDAVVLKVDGAGKPIWKQIYGAGGIDFGAYASELPSGQLLISANIGFEGNVVMALIKADAQGRLYKK